MKASSQALGFSCPSMYKTQHQEYGQEFLIAEPDVPTYGEFVETIGDFQKMEKILKNK